MKMKKSGKSHNSNKTFSWCMAFLCAIASLNVLSSCDSQDSFPIDTEATMWHTAKLYCDLTFDAPAHGRSSSSTYTPEDGDMMMLSFSVNNGKNITKTSGYAVYDSAQDSWTFQYYGNLYNCATTHCTVTYVGNKPTINTIDEETTVSFDHHSPILVCDDGLYSFDGHDVISLYATLSPKTGRIRFQNNEETSIEIKGFDAYTEMAPRSGEWSTYSSNYNYAPLPIEITASDDSFYSEYCYCYPYGDKGLRVKQGDNVYRWKKSLNDLLSSGKTGLVQLPSVNANNWYSDTYRVKDVQNITATYRNTSGWTQTQNQTKFYSNVGILVEFYYTITAKNYSSSYTDVPFIIRVSAYNEAGDYVTSWDWNDRYPEINVEFPFNNIHFHEDAAYYEIQFYLYCINAEITDFKISTF